jgi:hypothetical protein
MEYDKTDCPKWCKQEPEHNQGDYLRFHWGSHAGVYPNGGITDHVRVDAYMETAAGKDRPATVSFGAVFEGQDPAYTDLPPKGARVIASVIEILSEATPQQQKEYAAGIRAAADAIEAEQSEPEAG